MKFYFLIFLLNGKFTLTEPLDAANLKIEFRKCRQLQVTALSFSVDVLEHVNER